MAIVQLGLLLSISGFVCEFVWHLHDSLFMCYIENTILKHFYYICFWAGFTGGDSQRTSQLHKQYDSTGNKVENSIFPWFSCQFTCISASCSPSTWGNVNLKREKKIFVYCLLRCIFFVVFSLFLPLLKQIYSLSGFASTFSIWSYENLKIALEMIPSMFWSDSRSPRGFCCLN